MTSRPPSASAPARIRSRPKAFNIVASGFLDAAMREELATLGKEAFALTVDRRRPRPVTWREEPPAMGAVEKDAGTDSPTASSTPRSSS